MISFLISGRRGSNPQQPAWKAGTLPIELLPHWYNINITSNKNNLQLKI